MARELHRNGDRHGGVDRGLAGPRLPSAGSERGGGRGLLLRAPRRCCCSRARRCARRAWCARSEREWWWRPAAMPVCRRRSARSSRAGRWCWSSPMRPRGWRIARCRASRRRPPWPGRRPRARCTAPRARPACRCAASSSRHRRLPPGPPWRLLVLGGSQGAATLNESVPAALDRLRRDRGLAISVVHQAGSRQGGGSAPGLRGERRSTPRWCRSSTTSRARWRRAISSCPGRER